MKVVYVLWAYLCFSNIDRFENLEAHDLKIKQVEVKEKTTGNVGSIKVTSRIKVENENEETLIYIHIKYTRKTDGTFLTHQVTDCISEFGSWHR